MSYYQPPPPVNLPDGTPWERLRHNISRMWRDYAEHNPDAPDAIFNLSGLVSVGKTEVDDGGHEYRELLANKGMRLHEVAPETEAERCLAMLMIQHPATGKVFAEVDDVHMLAFTPTDTFSPRIGRAMPGNNGLAAPPHTTQDIMRMATRPLIENAYGPPPPISYQGTVVSFSSLAPTRPATPEQPTREHGAHNTPVDMQPPFPPPEPLPVVTDPSLDVAVRNRQLITTDELLEAVREEISRRGEERGCSRAGSPARIEPPASENSDAPATVSILLCIWEPRTHFPHPAQADRNSRGPANSPALVSTPQLLRYPPSRSSNASTPRPARLVSCSRPASPVLTRHSPTGLPHQARPCSPIPEEGEITKEGEQPAITSAEPVSDAHTSEPGSAAAQATEQATKSVFFLHKLVHSFGKPVDPPRESFRATAGTASSDTPQSDRPTTPYPFLSPSTNNGGSGSHSFRPFSAHRSFRPLLLRSPSSADASQPFRQPVGSTSLDDLQEAFPILRSPTSASRGGSVSDSELESRHTGSVGEKPDTSIPSSDTSAPDEDAYQDSLRPASMGELAASSLTSLCVEEVSGGTPPSDGTADAQESAGAPDSDHAPIPGVNHDHPVSRSEAAPEGTGSMSGSSSSDSTRDEDSDSTYDGGISYEDISDLDDLDFFEKIQVEAPQKARANPSESEPDVDYFSPRHLHPGSYVAPRRSTLSSAPSVSTHPSMPSLMSIPSTTTEPSSDGSTSASTTSSKPEPQARGLPKPEVASRVPDTEADWSAQLAREEDMWEEEVLDWVGEAPLPFRPVPHEERPARQLRADNEAAESTPNSEHGQEQQPPAYESDPQRLAIDFINKLAAQEERARDDPHRLHHIHCIMTAVHRGISLVVHSSLPENIQISDWEKEHREEIAGSPEMRPPPRSVRPWTHTMFARLGFDNFKTQLLETLAITHPDAVTRNEEGLLEVTPSGRLHTHIPPAVQALPKPAPGEVAPCTPLYPEHRGEHCPLARDLMDDLLVARLAAVNGLRHLVDWVNANNIQQGVQRDIADIIGEHEQPLNPLFFMEELLYLVGVASYLDDHCLDAESSMLETITYIHPPLTYQRIRVLMRFGWLGGAHPGMVNAVRCEYRRRGTGRALY
ncbi:hypothetical protein K523DRAFT_254242 [Schizophyllum commune Tattone D]|nr:hypothetical protein K523DRAFT_254242 [Schizophyllum commune Tattone D]